MKPPDVPLPADVVTVVPPALVAVAVVVAAAAGDACGRGRRRRGRVRRRRRIGGLRRGGIVRGRRRALVGRFLRAGRQQQRAAQRGRGRELENLHRLPRWDGRFGDRLRAVIGNTRAVAVRAGANHAGGGSDGHDRPPDPQHARRHEPAAAACGVRCRRGGRRAHRGRAARGRELGRGRPPRARHAGGFGRGDRVGLRREPLHARAAHARPVRQPHRRGDVPPELAPADGRRGFARLARRAVARAARRRARRALRALLRVVAGGGRARLPDLDDVRVGARAAAAAPISRRCSSRRSRRPTTNRSCGRCAKSAARCAAWR